eukprot:TRINITY_DN6810_c0_g1_i1.p1 TRINITY_DN6810_c0_g1~~TRINITY_DN6810_c0_g1_i1.p1  ORF type:complete len:192 (-),score=40.21 TRINITY_DN6810_c0_g1_i1:34-609(-)
MEFRKEFKFPWLTIPEKFPLDLESRIPKEEFDLIFFKAMSFQNKRRQTLLGGWGAWILGLILIGVLIIVVTPKLTSSSTVGIVLVCMVILCSYFVFIVVYTFRNADTDIIWRYEKIEELNQQYNKNGLKFSNKEFKYPRKPVLKIVLDEAQTLENESANQSYVFPGVPTSPTTLKYNNQLNSQPFMTESVQ